MSTAMKAALGLAVSVAATVVGGFVVNLLWDKWKAGRLRLPGVTNPYIPQGPGEHVRDHNGFLVPRISAK